MSFDSNPGTLTLLFTLPLPYRAHCRCCASFIPGKCETRNVQCTNDASTYTDINLNESPNTLGMIIILPIPANPIFLSKYLKLHWNILEPSSIFISCGIHWMISRWAMPPCTMPGKRPRPCCPRLRGMSTPKKIEQVSNFGRHDLGMVGFYVYVCTIYIYSCIHMNI